MAEPFLYALILPPYLLYVPPSFQIMEKYSRKFYSSAEWQAVREAAIKRDYYLCQDCLKRGIIRSAEEVHHIEKLTPSNIDDPSVALNLDNLVSLCRDCHAARHAKTKRYRVDEFGRVLMTGV